MVRRISLLSVCVVAACTKPNPDFCCTTPTDCASLGVETLRPCSSAQVCVDGACVAPQCETSADCSGAAPLCVANVCVATCAGDGDCAATPGAPLCSTDGRCVACTSDAQCSSASSSVCDVAAGTCRGCIADDECPGGICIESEGTCVPDDDVLFVSDHGVDATCTHESPCKSLEYALGLVGQAKSVIHIDASAIQLADADLAIAKRVTIDGTNTSIGEYANRALRILSGADASFDNVALSSLANGTLVVASGGKLAFYKSTLTLAGDTPVNVAGGSLSIGASVVTATGGASLTCANGGYLDLESVVASGVQISSTGCGLDVAYSRFDPCAQCLEAGSGQFRVHDSLFVAHDREADAVELMSANGESYFRFNTVANTSTTVGDGSAFVCDSTLEVHSDIFAYNSTTPHGPFSPCPTTYSLYDTNAQTTSTQGAGNQTADLQTIFVSLANGDYHPSASSIAVGHGKPGTDETRDLDGTPRPASPSMGALEP